MEAGSGAALRREAGLSRRIMHALGAGRGGGMHPLVSVQERPAERDGCYGMHCV